MSIGVLSYAALVAVVVQHFVAFIVERVEQSLERKGRAWTLSIGRA